MPKRADVIVCGVGGQGILLLAELLGTAAMKEGLDARVSEIHGMAQRGGSVICHVRVGERVLAPTVLDGHADVLVALEPVEALRALRFLGPRSLALVSTRPIRPVMVSLGMCSYPALEQVRSTLEAAAGEVLFVDALKLAEEAGNLITQNMVMAGALCATGAFPAGREAMLEAMKELVPARYLEVNLRAFELGEKAVGKP
ncbi:MAG TPA: indolepyruvate ferredoxin oxidoreductase subunit beta [Candidatus Bathyarchaeota archaeon]|nr:indolepyruvate ferredoxin oxidoreductase subunit beta [Candidatus Bathyarchaeota archaeon]